MNEQHIISLVQQKKHVKEALYILLDGACEHNVIRHLFMLEGVTTYKFLYLGTRYASVMEHGPVLAQVSAPSPFLSWFWTQGPGLHAGIALFSSLSPEALAEQLREILTVSLPSGTQVLFRFYDPRLAPAALALLRANGNTALTNTISAMYAPRYSFGTVSEWGQIMDTEQTHG